MSTKIIDLFEELTWFKKMRVLQLIAGWTQKEAAARYGTTQKNVWAWNHGKQIPQRINRTIIAKAHGLKVSDIFPSDMSK